MTDTAPAPLYESPVRKSTPKPAAAELVLWRVELLVEGYVWCHTWAGYAVNSIDATDKARRCFYGGLYGDRDTMERYPLKVRSCVQVRT